MRAMPRLHLIRPGRPLLAALTAVALLALSMAVGADDPPHVVVISIDGLKPEVYTAPGGPQIPTLRKLAAEGAYASGVVGVFPTVTYPSHTAIITGVPPALHGVYGNRILDPEETSNAAWYWYARDIKVPTLPGAVRSRGLRAAAVSWPVSVGLDVDYLFPEFFRSSHVETMSLLRALSKPATLLDDVEAARGSALPFPLNDTSRTDIATWLLRVHRPHLLLLHIFESDGAQHEHGPGSSEALAAIEGADRQVARVVDAIDASGMRDRTTIVIVSDHGFLPISRQLQFNAVLKREGLLTTDDVGRVKTWDAWFHPSGGSGFVFLKDPADARTRARVAALLAAVAADPANGVDRVLDANDLKALGADPRASFAVDMRPGFYTGVAHDVLLADTTSKGGHGFLPSRPDLHASLIMAGPNVPRAGNLGVVRMTQVAPTIASWFGVGLSPKADVPLDLKTAAQR
jgi:predicted AlkP superfamily pyrophosphatase or phosphodiesterase